MIRKSQHESYPGVRKGYGALIQSRFSGRELYLESSNTNTDLEVGKYYPSFTDAERL